MTHHAPTLAGSSPPDKGDGKNPNWSVYQNDMLGREGVPGLMTRTTRRTADTKLARLMYHSLGEARLDIDGFERSFGRGYYRGQYQSKEDFRVRSGVLSLGLELAFSIPMNV